MDWFGLLTWTTAILSVIGVVLNIKKRKECFIIWSFTNATWAMVDFASSLPAQGALFTVYFLLAIWGLWEWRRG